MGQNQNEGPSEASTQRLNSLGVDQERLEALLRKIEERRGENAASMRRTFIRWRFPNPTVELRLEQRGSGQSVVRVVTSDLSASGVGLLHSNYVYPGTPCLVTMTESSGVTARIRGVIARCNHLAGVVHEIGVKFDEKIDPGRFIEMENVQTRSQIEAVNPESLAGQVLYVEQSRVAQQWLEHTLRPTRVRATCVSTFDEALETAQTKAFDVVVCDQFLDGGKTGVEWVQALRAAESTLPAILLTNEGRKVSRDEAESVGIERVLVKPIRSEMLLQTLTEFIEAGPDGGETIVTTLAPDDPVRELIPEFSRDLAGKAKTLNEMIESDAAMDAYAVCLQISGIAPTLGFEELGAIAQRAGETLASTMSIAESTRPLKLLIDCCTRVEAA